MGEEENRKKYLISQAQQCRARLAIDLSALISCTDRDAFWSILSKQFRDEVMAIVEKSDDEHLGRLAAAGPPLNDDQPYIGCRGRSLMELVATEGLLDALAELVWAELEKERRDVKSARNQRRIKCRFCDFTVAKFGRQGSAPVSGFAITLNHVSKKHPDKMGEIEKHIGEDVNEEV